MLLPILQLLLLLVSCFVALTIVLIVKKQFGLPLLSLLMLAFSLLGVILMLVTLELQIKGMLRVFLVITGVSPIAMLVSIILHNAVSVMATKLKGRQIDEPVFLLFGIFACPTAFIIGDIASIIMVARKIFS